MSVGAQRLAEIHWLQIGTQLRRSRVMLSVGEGQAQTREVAVTLIDRQECLSYYSSMRAFSSAVGIMQDSSLPNHW